MIKKDNITYGELCREGCRVLQNAGIDDAKYDSLELLLFVFGMDRSRYLINAGCQADSTKVSEYEEVIAKRASHIPLQHITGEAWFYGKCFKVSPAVLIPRQDTEILVDEALKHLDAESCVLDMCTGSGCILISLALKSCFKYGLGVDILSEALGIAEINADNLKARNVFWQQSNLFENINKNHKFDVIVSNPPYIRTAQIENLSEEVRLHDPFIALDGKADGLHFYREITTKSSQYLNDGGWLIYEIGWDQADDVKSIMLECGYKEIQIIKDLAGLDRVAAGHR